MITYEQAKKYRDFGWSIIPVVLSKGDSKVEKKPGVQWKDYQTRQPTDEELHLWFDESKYNAVGLVTGKISGIVVVDIDMRENPIEIDSTMVSQTISGGKHYFFKWTEQLKNEVRFVPGVDFRGDGGFVVIPESELVGVGKYSWLKASRELPELPERIKALLIGTPNEPKQEIEVDLFRPAEVGERDNRATQISGWLAKKLPEKDWEFGFEILRMWDGYNPSPLPDHQLLKCWNSVASRERRKKTDEQTGASICKLFRGKEALDEHARLMNQYGGGMSTGFEELDKMFKFIPQQLYLISAPTHIGKTTLALNICARVATMGKRVLFASLEQGTFIAPRITTILNGPYPPALDILTADDMVSVKGLVDYINQMPQTPELICIDHIHFIKKNGKGATADIDEIMIESQNLAKQLEVPVILIAHTRKLNENRPPTLDDLRDSSSLSQIPSVVILLHRKFADGDKAQKMGSYFDNEGMVLVAKNRIMGVTGARKFILRDGGEFDFKVMSDEEMAAYWNKLQIENEEEKEKPPKAPVVYQPYLDPGDREEDND